MKKIKYVSIFVLLTFTVHAEYHQKAAVYKISTMTELEQFIDEDTLVIFDLDNTIFEAKGGYGHANWFYNQLAYGKSLGYDENEVIKKFYPHWVYSQRHAQVRAIEPITPALIKSLQKRKIPVIAATSRQTEVASVTLKQLSDIQVVFDPNILPDDFIAKFHAPTLSKNGVIFCADYNNKGEVLHTYFKKHKLQAKKIVFIEDSYKNIVNLIAAFAKEPVEIIGLYYPFVSQRGERIWDWDKADRDHYSAYLKNPKLPPFFLEKKQLVEYQHSLIEKNQSIKHPYEFFMFGKNFIGLPGVFSPVVFGGVGKFEKAIAIKPGIELLEIGCATGYFAVEAALKGAKKVVAVDIMPKAVDNTRLNARRFKVENIVDAREGDIFSSIQKGEKFDVIFWDIPFVHTDKQDLSDLEKGTFDPNHQLLTHFLKESDAYLKPKGKIYLSYSPSHGNIGFFYTLVTHYGWMVKVVEETKGDILQITLFELSKEGVKKA